MQPATRCPGSSEGEQRPRGLRRGCPSPGSLRPVVARGSGRRCGPSREGCRGGASRLCSLSGAMTSSMLTSQAMKSPPPDASWSSRTTRSDLRAPPGCAEGNVGRPSVPAPRSPPLRRCPGDGASHRRPGRQGVQRRHRQRWPSPARRMREGSKRCSARPVSEMPHDEPRGERRGWLRLAVATAAVRSLRARSTPGHRRRGCPVPERGRCGEPRRTPSGPAEQQSGSTTGRRCTRLVRDRPLPWVVIDGEKSARHRHEPCRSVPRTRKAEQRRDPKLRVVAVRKASQLCLGLRERGVPLEGNRQRIDEVDAGRLVLLAVQEADQQALRGGWLQRGRPLPGSPAAASAGRDLRAAQLNLGPGDPCCRWPRLIDRQRADLMGRAAERPRNVDERGPEVRRRIEGEVQQERQRGSRCRADPAALVVQGSVQIRR